MFCGSEIGASLHTHGEPDAQIEEEDAVDSRVFYHQGICFNSTSGFQKVLQTHYFQYTAGLY